MKNLLYVEDEKELRNFFDENLGTSFFNVKTACDAPSAIDLLDTHKYDVIVLDLMYVGDGSGRDILNYIENSKNELNAEIFIVSGYIDEEKRIEDDYFHILNPKNIYSKPGGFFDLLKRLEQISQE